MPDFQQITDAAAKLIEASDQAYAIVNGPSTGEGSSVPTESGPLPTFAKAIALLDEMLEFGYIKKDGGSPGQSMTGVFRFSGGFPSAQVIFEETALMNFENGGSLHFDGGSYVLVDEFVSWDFYNKPIFYNGFDAVGAYLTHPSSPDSRISLGNTGTGFSLTRIEGDISYPSVLGGLVLGLVKGFFLTITDSLLSANKALQWQDSSGVIGVNPPFANDAAAVAGGVIVGQVWHDTTLKINRVRMS